MMKPTSPQSKQLKQRAGLTIAARHAAADYYDEELDVIESLPLDAEHDEDDRDPEPEHRPYSEHAQERRTRRAKARADKSRV